MTSCGYCRGSGGPAAVPLYGFRSLRDQGHVFPGSRQVPVEKDQRVLLRARTGVDSIPVLVTPPGGILVGEDRITAYLDTYQPAPTEARAHRLRAEKARRRYLEEECECPSKPTTH